MQNDDTTTPPAPTPDAGHLTGFAPYTPITVGTGTVATDRSPPPGEDLAGQGEPVGWVWEEIFGGNWDLYASHVKPKEQPFRRNIEPLFKRAAPAPERAPGREEIAAALFESDYPGNDHLTWAEWLAYVAKHGTSSTLLRDIEACRRRADAVLALLILRDAPRDAGDGWRPIETAPKDGTSILIGRAERGVMFAYWYGPQECFCEHHTDQDIWEEHKQPTHWRPIPAPPSSNPTEDTGHA
jgi:hypothetical protein